MYTRTSVATIAVSVVMPLLATLAVVLRTKARSMQKQQLHADDYFIYASLVSNKAKSTA